MARRFYKLVTSGGLLYQHNLCDAAVGLASECCSNCCVCLSGSLVVKRGTVYFIQGVDRQAWSSKNCK